VKNLKSAVEEIESALDAMEAEVRCRRLFTAYGLSFLKASRGPENEATFGER
jgi:hypothetical protein